MTGALIRVFCHSLNEDRNRLACRHAPAESRTKALRARALPAGLNGTNQLVIARFLYLWLTGTRAHSLYEIVPRALQNREI